MAQSFYTLEEAAQRLGVPTQQLNQMAQRREVRAFADRGTWRFRTQDIEELARQRGLGSDPGIQPSSAPSSGRSAGKSSAESGDVFPFKLDAGSESEFGSDIFDAPETGGKKPGSDSDVRLVPAGSKSDSEVKVKPKSDSDVKLEKAQAKATKAKKAPGSDSGVKLVPESDSDVKIVQQPPPHAHPEDSQIRLVAEEDPLKPKSDSDIRLEHAGATDSGIRKGSKSRSHEINLEDELLLAEDSPIKAGPKKGTDSSSEFDITPGGSSPTEEMEIDLKEASDVNLRSPADSGISLEPNAESSDESLDFELSLEEEKPAGAKRSPREDSSEFELSLEEGGLAPMDEEKASEENIFETEFQVPAVEEQASSAVPELSDEDTSLEGSSEFELALSDEDMAPEGETGSEVVVIEEETGDESQTVSVETADLEGSAIEEAVSEPAGLELEEAVAEELGAGPALVPAAVEGPEPEWGALPTAFLLPAAVIMLFTGFLLFEMLQSVWSYDKPSFISGPISEMFGKMLK